MTTTVEILTGNKTVLDYILKPILKDQGMRTARMLASAKLFGPYQLRLTGEREQADKIDG